MAWAFLHGCVHNVPKELVSLGFWGFKVQGYGFQG